MRYNEITSINEGKHDPHIFKVVFMAGGPGSGKSTIARKLFAGTGLKLVDRDQILLQFKKLGKDIDRDHIGQLRDKQRENYIGNRLGMIIDGTARKAGDIADLKARLEKLGYEAIMVFVNTDLEEAKKRVIARAERTGRTVPEEVVVSSWNASQINMVALEQIFDRFYLVDNTQPADLSKTAAEVRNWLNTPVAGDAVQRWLNGEPDQL